MNEDINELYGRIEELISEIRRLGEMKDIIVEMTFERRGEIEKIQEQINKLKSVERKRGKIYE